MESEPPLYLLENLHLFLWSGQINFNFSITLLIILIICSALVSASEVAYFSLSVNDIKTLEENSSKNSKRALLLKDRPRYLLATILIGNNFVNIAIVVVSEMLIRNSFGENKLLEIGTYLYQNVFLGFGSPESIATIFNFFITVGCVTFMLVLFGEALPKIYATINKMKIVLLMAGPLTALRFLFMPLSKILVLWTGKLENRLIDNNNQTTTKEDIDAAIDLTVVNNNDQDRQEAVILKGIVNFGDISARQIMRPRMDVIAIDDQLSFKELMKIVKDSGYSRLPVYVDDIDNVVGILYVKDLIAHIEKPENFDWKPLVRNNVLFVPESKKIDELLREFQSKRTHMAIVVDEYGGTAGIATLEDIMEEVVGDIKDEFDVEEDIDYIRITDNNYIFEGKTLLKDVCRVVGENTNFFDDVRDEADTLAGLILEKVGNIPKPEREVSIDYITLKVVSVTKKRIEKISLTINK